MKNWNGTINSVSPASSQRILFAVLTVLLFVVFAFQLVYHAVRTCYREAIRIAPNDAEAYNNLGTVQAKSGHYDEAFHNFERSITLKPDLAVAHYNLGVLSLRTKRREIALQHYGVLTSLNPILATKLYSGIYQGKVLLLDAK